MGGFLFDDIIFGPVKSRRLGNSLGINLLPLIEKHCSFDCVYCECGWTPGKYEQKLPRVELVIQEMTKKFQELYSEENIPDNLTFAGNGEPTMHPDFAEIIDHTIKLRDRFFPKAQISVLSNASYNKKPSVYKALMKVDNNIQKLDAGTESTFQAINKPLIPITLSEVVDQLSVFKHDLIIQTLFMRGFVQGVYIDNTTDFEVNAWLELIKELAPKQVMIYPVARSTPDEQIDKITEEELIVIGEKVKALGIKPTIYS